MNGAGGISSSKILHSGNVGDWKSKCVTDMNGDGNPDILFQNTVGQLAVWYLNGSSSISSSKVIYGESLGDWRLR
jgi:hypothetical protein